MHRSTFSALQVWELLLFMRSKLTAKQLSQLVYLMAVGAGAVGAAGTALLIASGKLNPWTGRWAGEAPKGAGGMRWGWGRLLGGGETGCT